LIENSSLFETGNRYLKKFFSELMTKSSAYAELFVCQQFLKKVCNSLLATNPQLFLDEHFVHFSTQEP